MQPTITPGVSFKENLQLLPAIDGIARITLRDATGDIVATIDNQPGKQGSLAVYYYLQQAFGTLDTAAAEHALQVFGEHTEDARNRPGAHPNIDRLFDILNGSPALTIEATTA